MIYIYCKHIKYKFYFDLIKHLMMLHKYTYKTLHNLDNHLDNHQENENMYILIGVDITMDKLPKQYILVQLLNLTVNTIDFLKPELYKSILSNAIEIWDFSMNNINVIKNKYNINIPYRLLKSEVYNSLFRFNTNTTLDNKKPIDILFYGSITKRRYSILEFLNKFKLNIKAQSNDLWGLDKDNMMKQSKIILNMNYYDNDTFTISRVLEAGCNKCFIISENGCDMKNYSSIESSFKIVPYNKLVSTCLYYLKKPKLRNQLIKNGYEYCKQYNKINDYENKLLDLSKYNQNSSNNNSVPSSSNIVISLKT